MADEYGFSERRNKGKDKRKNNRRFPFKKGGSMRAMGENAIIKK